MSNKKSLITNQNEKVKRLTRKMRELKKIVKEVKIRNSANYFFDCLLKTQDFDKKFI